VIHSALLTFWTKSSNSRTRDARATHTNTRMIAALCAALCRVNMTTAAASHQEDDVSKGAEAPQKTVNNTSQKEKDIFSTEKKKKRPVCSRCHRPAERACICKALPDSPIVLEKCELVVLQHPHESRRKNRSLPLVELCVEHLHTAVARRFGDQIDSHIMELLQDENRNVMLVYPSKDAVSLTEGLQQIRERKSSMEDKSKRKLKDEGDPDRIINVGSPPNHDTCSMITVVLLDGTWKYAREMHKTNVATNQYPNHLIQVALTPKDFEIFANSSNFKPARFDIRTPPSPDHLSTAECIAWIVSTIEGNASHYDTIMKPLDLMVEQWHSFSNRGTFSFTNGDGTIEDATRDKVPNKGRKRKQVVARLGAS